MAVFRKIKTFFLLSGTVKWLFFKAIAISAMVKVALAFLPFKFLLNWFGQVNQESEISRDPETKAIRDDVKIAIALCAKYVFWKTACYTQALTCKILLKQYRLPTTIYIGFRKSEAGSYQGHAWARSYDTVVTGYKGTENYIVQSYFT